MSLIKKSSLYVCMLFIITCSKDSDVASDSYSSNISQNTTTPTVTSPTVSAPTVTQYNLTASAGEGGSVSTTGGTYDDGTAISIIATPNEGYEFIGWTGSDSSSSTITITLTANTTIEAIFSQVSTSTTDTSTSTETSTSTDTPPPSTEASTYSISVSAQGSANYILTGDDANGSVSGNDPSVSLTVGDTINFNVSAQGHPFYLIKTSDGGVGSGNLIDGVSNNGAQSATVSWTPTEAGTYYYICEYHPSMLGTITVTE